MLNIPVHLAIRSRRESEGLTQAQLAARCRIAQANLSHIERGSRDLTVSMLVRIASALGTTASALLAGGQGSTNTQAHPPDRDALERIAATAINRSAQKGKRPLSSSERVAAAHLSRLVPGLSRTAVRDSDAYRSQQYLKQTFGSETLKTMISKVQKSMDRSHAPQND